MKGTKILLGLKKLKNKTDISLVFNLTQLLIVIYLNIQIFNSLEPMPNTYFGRFILIWINTAKFWYAATRIYFTVGTILLQLIYIRNKKKRINSSTAIKYLLLYYELRKIYLVCVIEEAAEEKSQQPTFRLIPLKI